MTQKLLKKTKQDRETKVKLMGGGVIIDKELLHWTQKFIERYRPALEALAKK